MSWNKFRANNCVYHFMGKLMMSTGCYLVYFNDNKALPGIALLRVDYVHSMDISSYQQ